MVIIKQKSKKPKTESLGNRGFQYQKPDMAVIQAINN